ncbi:MAG: acyl-CoA thioesterase [Anaerolineaceae bacterium]|nr:acyl-CoA thioesterase [Anaerolineaceae bacterium]
MSNFHFSYPIQVRYSDIDAQWHVNNTRFGTYIESARLAYLQHLNLWDGKSFQTLGVIVADVHIAYIAPIFLGQSIEVKTCVSKIGTKSLQFSFEITDVETGKICATAETINVAYDFVTSQSIPVPADWRQTISDFEKRTF